MLGDMQSDWVRKNYREKINKAGRKDGIKWRIGKWFYMCSYINDNIRVLEGKL